METYNDLPGTGLCCFFSLNISCKGSIGLDIALLGDSNPGLDLFKIELLEVGGGKGDCGFKRLDPPLTASSICRWVIGALGVGFESMGTKGGIDIGRAGTWKIVYF